LDYGNAHSAQLQTRFASGLATIPNWARPERILPLSHDRNSFRREHALNGRFVVMYSGNIGLAHNFEAILEAATLLQGVEPDLLFLFVGNGPRLLWVREESARRGLTNLRFIESQPREHLAESLNAADVHLVSLRDELCGLVVPSKFYGIAAAGRPVVFLGPANCEVAREIVREQCGSVLPAATGAGLVKSLRGWRADPAARSAAGARARAYDERTGLRLATDSFEALLHHLLPDLTGR
jgi:glycosyltransferase involved in cell wall biosynthesis